MIEGEWYHITYDDFTTRFSFGQADKNRFQIYLHNPLGENEMKFMYAPGQEGNAGTINGLYTFYSVLNKLFRKTIYPRDGDPTNISHYAKNLLANMRDGAPAFSVIDYIWEEIKCITLNPQKNCVFAPYLMFIIKDVTNRSFPKDVFHMPLRTTPTKKSLIPPAQASSPPKADPTPQQQHEAAEPVRPAGYTGQTDLSDQGQSSTQQREKSSSPIKKLFGLLFGLCRSHHAIETRHHEERNARKKLQKDMKEVKKELYPNKTLFPLGSKERESNPPTPFQQRYANYGNFDPSHPFAPYASTSHMGFDSQLRDDFGQQGPTFDAPPPEQPRPSMADEFATSIFGDPNPGMASSSHTSLHHSTMPPFCGSSMYTRAGSHWVAPHDYAPSDDQ
jgi:hypothetical protein